MLLAITIAALCTVLIVSGHFYAIFALSRKLRNLRERRWWQMNIAVLAFLCLHIIEMGIFAVVYLVCCEYLELGHLVGGEDMGLSKYIYFSFETYSTVGYGDVVLRGEIQLLAGVESLIGIVLLASTGAATYGVAQRMGQEQLEAEAVEADDKA